MPRAAQNAVTKPYWSNRAPFPKFPKLQADARVDVVVIGGGIMGLTAAYLLASAGRSVVLLERDTCAQGDTGHTSAHLTMVPDLSIAELISGFGRDQAQAILDGGLAAIAQIEAIALNERIGCEFEWVPGYRHAIDSSESAVTDAHREADAAKGLGFDAEFTSDVPLFGTPGVRFGEQARFHPRRYLAGVARRVIARSGLIYEHSPAEEFVESPLGVKSNGFTVSCDEIVLATHNPLLGISSVAGATLFQTKLALYTSYVVAGRAPHGQIPDALFWDTADPYHYLRVERHPDYDVVIYGGEDHKTGQTGDTQQCFQRLEDRLRSLVPGVELTHRWSGQVIETPDGLPYIGETAPHQFAGTGFAGNGMTFGTLSAMMAHDHIVGRKNPWTDIFDTGRTAITKGLWEYVKENTDYPYYMIRDRFAGAEGKSLRAVKEGEGKIIEVHGQKAAVSRVDGRTIVRSAVCTHMGCLVGWNTAERTWDCPCHGSRFRPTGEVIGGPAETPLPALKPNEKDAKARQ
jgi:glycine/D-amino acid oxidase-like deaminating enzyme/nitrite reductase/ring-hydroxylating ferredoxin subunit